MRKWKTIGVLLLCLALAGSIACNPFGSNEEVTQQLVEVVQGDLIISVSGSGNIEVSEEANLVFDVGGRIDKIYVDDGDKVSEGDVLAKLETDALELALTQTQVALTTQQVALTTKQVAVTTANVTLRATEHSLDEARDIYTWPEIKEMQEEVDEAKDYVDYANDRLDAATTDAEGLKWIATLAYAQARLTAAEAKLDARVMSYDTEEVAIKKMEVGLAQQSLELAQQSLELTQQSLEQAQQSLEQAQKQLDEATLTTPFDGVVASVYVKEGDVIPSPSMAPKVIIHLIDLTTMELQVEVDEIDIPGVEVGQRAIIEVDAVPDLPVEGEVTFISLLSKETGGVVLYEVKIDFAAPEGSGLRVGMSATVDIIIDERSGALLVPSRAITTDSEGNPMAKVMVNEQTEERRVVIGISDGFDTEIIGGLNEGEVVVIERRAK